MMDIHGLLAMIAFFAFIVIFILGTIDGEIKPIIISFIVFIVFMGSYVFGLYKLSDTPWVKPDRPYKTSKIVALSDNNMASGRISGGMFIVRGYYNEDLYYQYMKRLGDGGFKAGKVKADKTTLYYTDENYRVESYKKTRHWLYFWEEETYYEIHIPEGSITDEYLVDLQ